MPRKPADQTVQRKDVLLAAASVFRERGYHGATMADIAQKVHLTAGSLYHHFPAGKSDLLLAVLIEGLTVAATELDAILADNLSPTETLTRMIRAHVVNVTENVAVGAAMVFEIRAVIDLGNDATGRDTLFQRRDEFEKRYRSVIERGIAAGEFRPIDVPIFTKAMLGAHNWVSVWYRPGGRLTGAEIADRIADFFLTALLC